MYNLLLRMFYHPVVFFFILPLFYMALGVIFSLPYDSMRILSLLFFYLFILMNQMLENILLRISDEQRNFSTSFFLILEALNIGSILYFGWQHSWLASLVLVGFTLIIQCQFLLTHYDLEDISVTLSNFFKIFLLNGFAFYIGTNFIHPRYFSYFSGLFFPLFLYEASRMKTPMKRKILMPFIGLSYVIGLVLLWGQISNMSLILFIILPFAWLVIKDYNRQTATTFALLFSFIYILLNVYAFM